MSSLISARKRNFVSAEVVFQRLHSTITLKRWKRSARQIHSLDPQLAAPQCLCAALRVDWRARVPDPVVVWCPCACVFLFTDVSRVLGVLLRPCLDQTSSGSWRRSSISCRHLRTRLLVASTLFVDAPVPSRATVVVTAVSPVV